MRTNEAILKVEGLSKAFGKNEVLSKVGLELPPDSVTCLLGSNGAGKSTLLRCVLGLVRPTSGRVRVLGEDPWRASRRTLERIGFVPDHPDAYGWMNAEDLFYFLGAQYPGWSAERAARLCERLRIPMDRSFDEMSRGEGAKVNLAAALIPAPKLLLLDEPFARLAPPVREEVLSVFVEEAPLPGGAALLATHDLEVAARVADRVVMLDRGRVVRDERIDELLEAHAEKAQLTATLRELYPELEREERREVKCAS